MGLHHQCGGPGSHLGRGRLHLGLWPGSTWRKKAISALQEAGIEAIGRYARWHFQGIADSIRDGLGATIPTRSQLR